MIRVACVLVLLACAGPARADDKKVTITFLGGAKKTPLEGLKVTVRGDTGDWTADRKNKLKDATSDKSGAVAFALAPGRYYIDVTSDKPLPYLPLPVGHKGRPGHYDRMITVGAGAEQSFDFNLADACKLVLRAVDADTGKPLPGVVFVTESETAEDWGIAIRGDNLGARHAKADEATDKDGYFTRLLGPREGYTYFAWPPPQGYEQVGKLEVTLPTPLGKEKVEHTFKLRKKDAPRVRAPVAGGDEPPAAVERARERGAATAGADIKAGRAVVLYYGKPWSAGKPLVDDDTGLAVEVVGGCDVTKTFAAEIDAYNAAVREWHARTKKPGP